jgi:hypothetical protein
VHHPKLCWGRAECRTASKSVRVQEPLLKGTTFLKRTNASPEAGSFALRRVSGLDLRFGASLAVFIPFRPAAAPQWGGGFCLQTRDVPDLPVHTLVNSGAVQPVGLTDLGHGAHIDRDRDCVVSVHPSQVVAKTCFKPPNPSIPEKPFLDASRQFPGLESGVRQAPWSTSLMIMYCVKPA